MAIIRDIQELKDWQTRMDAEAMRKIVADTLATHPGTTIIPGSVTEENPDGVAIGVPDLSGWPEGATPGPGSVFPRPQKLIDAISVGDCLECGEPAFLVRQGQTGRTVPVCRACFNAVMRQSLQHHQYTAEICWECKIDTDSLGLISAANHRTKPYEDEVNSDGITRPGIGPLMRVGRIDLTNDVLTVLPV